MIVNPGLRRDLVAGGVTNFDAVTLPGTSGSYVSTPDSVANSVTGDIDIRVRVALTDWTPATDAIYVGKDETATRRNYAFFQRNSTASPSFYWSANGSTVTVVSATASLPAGTFVDGTQHWVRVTFDVDNGAGGSTAVFYWSDDGATWTQLGSPVVSAGVATITDTVSPVEIGSIRLGTVNTLSGKVYQVQIYNGINGTLAVGFDAARYAGGTTLTGSTGEVWTLNGGAVINPA